jgi:hypothetical protein
LKARQIIDAAGAAGVSLSVDGDSLVLRSGSPPPQEVIILRACRHLAARYRRRGRFLEQLKGERVGTLGEDRARLTHGRMIKRQVRT